MITRQNQPSSPRFNQTVLVWIVLFLLSFLVTAISRRHIPDDAYITFRYARNIAGGLGFVYNPGETVLGTTTPLYTLVLASLTFLTRLDVPTLSLIVGALSLGLSGCLIFEWSRARGSLLAWGGAILFITTPLLPWMIGMESLFLLALLLLAIDCYRRRRLTSTALLAGALLLVRYEMLIVWVVIALNEIWKKRGFLWLWPGAAPVLLWLMYASVTFGSPVPLSASVKLSAPHVPFLLGLAVLGFWFVQTAPLYLSALILAIFGGARLLVERQEIHGVSILAQFTILYFIVSAAVAGSFPWYYAPLLPGWVLLTLEGAGFVMRAAGRVSRPSLKLRTMPLLALFLCLAGMVAAQLSLLQQTAGTAEERTVQYQNVAAWISVHAPQARSIAVFEIGYLGYQSNLYVVDLAGLVTPALYPYVSGGPAPALSHALKQYGPDLVLVDEYNDNGQAGILIADSRYHLCHNFSNSKDLYARIPCQAAALAKE